jgi:hypothetical protein
MLEAARVHQRCMYIMRFVGIVSAHAGKVFATGQSIACSAGEEGAENKDFFSEKRKRKVYLSVWAQDNAFVSAQAARHWLSRFGEVNELDGKTVFKISDSQKQLLNTTIAVCTVRSNGSRVTTEMMTALIKVIKWSNAREVRKDPAFELSTPCTRRGFLLRQCSV